MRKLIPALILAVALVGLGATPALAGGVRVAAEATALMDLSHGWLLVAGTRVRWVETADELAEAIRSLGAACIVVGLGGEATEVAA